MIRTLIRWWHWHHLRRKYKARRLELGRALMNRRMK